MLDFRFQIFFNAKTAKVFFTMMLLIFYERKGTSNMCCNGRKEF